MSWAINQPYVKIKLIYGFSPCSPSSLHHVSITETDIASPLLKTRASFTRKVKNLPAEAGNVRDVGSIFGSGKSPGRGHGNPLWYSWLENAMDRGAWQAMVYKVAKSQTWLKRLSTHCKLPSSLAWTTAMACGGFPHIHPHPWRSLTTKFPSVISPSLCLSASPLLSSACLSFLLFRPCVSYLLRVTNYPKT